MAKKSKQRIWIEYLIARATLTAVSLLPRKAAIGAGLLVANVGYLTLRRLRRVGSRNLEIAFPEMSAADRRRLLKRSFRNLGRMLGEVSQFPRSTPATLAQLIEGFPQVVELFEKGKAGGHGVIVVIPHLGNWELLAFAYSALSEPVSYLVRPIDNPLVEEMVASIRMRFGNRPINKKDSALAALRVLRKGRLLGVLADVNVVSGEGVFVPFFGVPACTTVGVATLASRANARIIPVCVVWNEKAGRYSAVTGEIIEPIRTGDRKEDLVRNTEIFTAAIEEFVRAYPDQWVWIHKRWKTRPPGEKDLYEGV